MPTTRYALALDLVDDPAKVAAYEHAHQKIWPEVRDHLRAQGVTEMEIYRLGTRLFMVMEVDPAVFDAARFAAASAASARIQAWETLMGQYQLPTPWTPAGTKWAEMPRIFQLSTQ